MSVQSREKATSLGLCVHPVRRCTPAWTDAECRSDLALNGPQPHQYEL